MRQRFLVRAVLAPALLSSGLLLAQNTPLNGPVHNPMGERISPERWRLAGKLKTDGPLTPASRSLKLVRRADRLSPQIRSAMNAGSTVPVLEIDAPRGKVILRSVKVVNVVAAPPNSPQRPYGPSNFKIGNLKGVNPNAIDALTANSNAGKSKGGGSKAGTSEVEEVHLTFASIQLPRKKKSGLTDNWNAGK